MCFIPGFFFGISESDEVTTFGPGEGSDLFPPLWWQPAPEKQITLENLEKDTEGFMTGGTPRVISPIQKLISVLSYEEASELAYFRCIHSFIPRNCLRPVSQNQVSILLLKNYPESRWSRASLITETGCFRAKKMFIKKRFLIPWIFAVLKSICPLGWVLASGYFWAHIAGLLFPGPVLISKSVVYFTDMYQPYFCPRKRYWTGAHRIIK